jgi:arylsulfatase A-like enzyme
MQVACCLLLACRTIEAAQRPNVIVILTDDQGWGDLSVHGNTNLSTPHIDSLARDGALFERFYVCPVCSPTRAEFLTGRYHPRGNVWNVSQGGERLDLDEKTIGDAFKSAGYATGAFGKWHNGTQYPYHPNARGFDEFYGFCSGHWGDYFDPPLEHNGKVVRGQGFIIDDLTDHALRFIDEHREQPFFCYLPYNTPHTPMQVPDRFYDKFRNAELKLRYDGPQPEDPKMTRAALAMCENIDWNVGRVLEKLSELKLQDNTIVIYFCDNGPNSFRWNGGMKGRKGSTDEGGVRSPLLVRWPGKIHAGRKVPHLAAAIDLLPTLTELAGVKVVGKKPLDGISLVTMLNGIVEESPNRMIFSHWGGNVSVRTEQYRLDGNGKLFDMIADPGQKQDVTAQRPQVAERLSAAVADWRKNVLSEMQRVVHPFTVGYREFPVTQLPARDGIPVGNIRRSDKAPNCSFLTNWTSVDDRITWDIDVATTGRYLVEIDYACSADNIGSTIEMSFGDSKLAGTVSMPHDPPLRGAEHDRYPRNGESLVKDFKPMKLGEMPLSKGHGLLTLRATQMTGKEVMEVRGLVLTLLE